MTIKLELTNDNKVYFPAQFLMIFKEAITCLIYCVKWLASTSVNVYGSESKILWLMYQVYQFKTREKSKPLF